MTRNQINKYFFACVLLAAITLAVLFTQFKPQASFGPAPDISFKTLANKQVDLKQLQGKVVLVTFWATDCPSCLKEIPHLKSIYKKYHSLGLELFAVSMYYDRPNHIVEAVKIHQIPYDIVLDLRMKLATAFGNVRLTPTTFLISPQGKIVYQNTGTFELLAMQSQIESFLPLQGNN